MAKKYKLIRVYEDSANELNKRLDKINTNELKKIGIKNKKIKQIDFTHFIFKNKIFISDSELKEMAKRRWKVKLC